MTYSKCVFIPYNINDNIVITMGSVSLHTHLPHHHYQPIRGQY